MRLLIGVSALMTHSFLRICSYDTFAVGSRENSDVQSYKRCMKMRRLINVKSGVENRGKESIDIKQCD